MNDGSNQLVATSSRWRVFTAWALLLAALTATFAHTACEIWLRWFPAWNRVNAGLYDRLIGGESYYTHGPIIPVVSAVIALLLVRHTRIPLRPDRSAGAAVLGAGLTLHLLAALMRVNFLSGLAAVVALAGLVVLLWGPGALRRLWFPLALLLFMVPLPEVTIADVNFGLKMLSANWGVGLANGMGAGVHQMGNQVLLPNGQYLVVANACNGLRTLISLLAFGALYAYICRLRGAWRLGLFAMAVPVAVASNTLRVASLILVGRVWGADAASGWFHDTSGLLIFVVSFALMFLLEQLVLWFRRLLGRPAIVLPLFAGQRKTAADGPQWPAMAAAAASPRGAAAIVAVALVAVATFSLNRAGGPGPTPQELKSILPLSVTLRGQPMSSTDIGLDEETLTILENPSYLFRQYDSPSLPSLYLCLIFSRDNRKGVHPPNLCLEGQGREIVQQGDVTVQLPGGQAVPCRELVVQEGQETSYFLYTYRCGRSYTSSFWGQQAGIVLNSLLRRDASGALIRVSLTVSGTVADARDLSKELLAKLLPDLEKNWPQ